MIIDLKSTTFVYVNKLNLFLLIIKLYLFAQFNTLNQTFFFFFCIDRLTVHCNT